jgi:DNA-binding CsgD family transcriptional regulator
MATTTARDVQVHALVKAGWSEREIARAIGVSRSTVWATKQRLKAAGKLEAEASR